MEVAIVLYARLQTGLIVDWWCPSIRQSVHPGLRPSVTVFHTFLPHIYASTYVAEMLFNFILLHVRSNLIVVKLCEYLLELCHKWTLEYWEYTGFHVFLPHHLTYWLKILFFPFMKWTTGMEWVSSILVIFCISYAPSGTKNTGNRQFSELFSCILWHIELKFCISHLFMNFISSLSFIISHKFLSEFPKVSECAPSWN